MEKIKISFLERKIVSLNRSADGIRGYEPAKIKTSKGISEGRVIDVDRLKTAELVENEVYSTLLDLKDVSFDLSILLESEVGGEAWLEKFKEYFQHYFKQEIPMNLSIRRLEFPFGARYTLYPKDIELISKLSYHCPSGNITSLSDKIVYYEIHPPMKLKGGEWIPNLHYNRKVEDSELFFESYSVKDPTEKHFSVSGCLLGKLALKSIENRLGDFRKFFPMTHFLEVAYPISLRDSISRNPIIIKFELA